MAALASILFCAPLQQARPSIQIKDCHACKKEKNSFLGSVCRAFVPILFLAVPIIALFPF